MPKSFTATSNCSKDIRGDETPAAPEIIAAMDVAKRSIKDALNDNKTLLKEVMDCYDKR